jgi:hypothetical protein
MTTDVVKNALWQFNEAVSLLTEARLYTPECTGISEEIDESLPTIREALTALADEVTAQAKRG